MSGPRSIFADLAQDAKGRLRAVWLDGSRALQYRASKNGRRWGKTIRLVPSGRRIYGLQAAAGPDGKGIVVWHENRCAGHVRAARFDAADSSG